MVDAPASFDWHDHVEIGSGFTAAQRQLVEQSLNDISKFADGDGQKLLSQARQMGGSGKKVQIVPGDVETDSNHHINPDGTIIPQVRINFEAQATLGVNTPDGVKPMSLTATMVHEFNHLATSTDGINAQAEQTLMNQLQLPSNDPKTHDMRQHVRDMAAANGVEVAHAVTQMLLQPHTYGEWLKQSGSIDAGERLMLSSPVDNAAALQRDGILSKHQPAVGVARIGTGLSQLEEDAAGYTHALIEKNYGSSVATPVQYFDAVVTQQPHTLTALPEPTQIYETKGFEPTHYTAGDLGNLPSPSVPAHTKAGPVQGRQ